MSDFMAMSPINMEVYNKSALIAVNDTVTVSIRKLEQMLNAARQQGVELATPNTEGESA